MSTDTKNPKNQNTPKEMGVTEFCSKNGCSPYMTFYLKKMFKSEKFTESDWKKKIKEANGN